MSTPSPSTPVRPDLLARLPKTDLHFHMAGTLRPATLVALARQYELPLPRPVDTLYSYRDFYDFIDVLRIAAQAVRSGAEPPMATMGMSDASLALATISVPTTGLPLLPIVDVAKTAPMAR